MNAATMPTAVLGRNGPVVSALGLGCMGMSSSYGPADDDESLATLQAALERGVTLLDSGDFYGMGHNEMLIRKALAGGKRAKAVISVKFGAMRGPNGHAVGYDGRPQAVKNSLAYSLQRLGTDYIDIYRPARLDPAVPIEETVGAVAEMVQAGYVRYIGLSEVGVTSIRRALTVHPICDVQLEYSLMSRGIESAILPVLRQLGIAVTAYGVLSRGLLGGHRPSAAANEDIRTFRMPRFEAGNIEKNLALVDALQTIARSKGVTAAQLAVAWVRGQGQDIVPVVGARRRDQLTDALGAMDLRLDASELAAISAAVPAEQVAGTRYATAAMAELDSERA